MTPDQEKMLRHKAQRRVYWMGVVEDKPHFYSDPDYYNGVIKADLFKSKTAALKCYQAVRKIIIDLNNDI